MKDKEMRRNCPSGSSKLGIGIGLEEDEEPKTPCLCPKEMAMDLLPRMLRPSNQTGATETKIDLVPDSGVGMCTDQIRDFHFCVDMPAA